MTNRISTTFATTKAAQRAALVTFIMAGDPDHETTAKILAELPKAGADIIELGMPFSDPMADGPSIQAAGIRALKGGATMLKTLSLVRGFRAQNSATPIVLMGYFNPILAYQPEKFLADAAAAGVDGLILVDLPPEEDADFRAKANKLGIDIIRLATPTTDAARLPKVLDGASGFLYYVSIAGITGTKSATVDHVRSALTAIRNHTAMPLAVGFGIKTPEQLAELAAFADGVIVGSALVDRIAANLDGNGKIGAQIVPEISALVRAFAAATLRKSS
ncbi:MAG: tryptophan synthase subunit alpha [Alphaproteobacteria bacterium]|nr:tryptophan synthase subunit alpha [Alphaproteobacteria bacterium]